FADRLKGLRINQVLSLLTAWMLPAVGASAPEPNSSALNGRNAAACRVTLMDCTRSQGNMTPAGAPAAFGGGVKTGACPAVVVNVFSINVAIALPSISGPQSACPYLSTCPQARQ